MHMYNALILPSWGGNCILHPCQQWHQ